MEYKKLTKTLKITAFSDTHGHHREVDLGHYGDVLVYAGDLMTDGWKKAEVLDFAAWFSSQPHEYKVLVAGNHDRLFESNQAWCKAMLGKDVIYLRDEAVDIEGWKFYGSPVQPWFHSWAFNVPRGPAIKEYWDKIPDDTDVLITHGPPYGILDQIIPENMPVVSGGTLIHLPTEHLGCEELRKAVERVKPMSMFFGHIHGSYGIDPFTGQHWGEYGTHFYNVAICDERYKPVNNPITVEMSKFE